MSRLNTMPLSFGEFAKGLVSLCRLKAMKQLPMKRLNNHGFSLIEVLVAVGVMSLMSFFLMDMISNQNKAIKTTQHSMDINEAQNQIQRYMIDSTTCKNTLLGYSFPVGVEVPITNIKRNATDILMTSAPPNNKIGGIEIESLKVKRISGPDLELNVRFKKTVSSTSYGGEFFLRKIKLSAQFETATPNIIKACFTEFDNGVATAVQMACTQLCPTCTWNPTTLTCVRPPTASPAIYINPLTGQLTTSRGFQKSGGVFCNCYNPGCPGGSSQVGSHWCSNHGSSFSCPGGKKIGHVNCQINQPLGYLSSTP